MQNKFKEFWISEFTGNGILKAYNKKPEILSATLIAINGREKEAYKYYQVVEKSALVSANAEISSLTKQLENKSKEIGRSEHRGNTVDYIYDKVETYGKQIDELNVENSFMAIQIKKLTDELTTLKKHNYDIYCPHCLKSMWFKINNEIPKNAYVVKSDKPSKYEELEAQNKRLTGTLEEIGADMYVGYKKSCGCGDAAEKCLKELQS